MHIHISCILATGERTLHYAYVQKGFVVDHLAPLWSRDSLQSLRNHIILDYGDLRKLVDGLRVTNLRIGATIGSFDVLHPGHARYLMAAKSHCDMLIVGADSDLTIKIYKKDDSRPVVPQDERLEMLLHTGYPDFVTLVDDVDKDGKWQYRLLEEVRPDVFVTSIGSYSDDQLAEIGERCADVIQLPRQAETSTSEKVRQMMMVQGKSLATQLRVLVDKLEAGEL